MSLTHEELLTFFVSLGIMLLLARVVAELGRKLKLPMVMGELIVGIILGPTVLGMLFPDAFDFLFPKDSNLNYAFDGLFKLSVVMLLFVAGMEVQLPMVLKQGKVAIYTSVLSMIFPFATGFLVAWYIPELVGYHAGQTPKWIFALFFGTALSISALPVIAKILMDLNLYKTQIGMIIIAAAMFDDLVGWLVFSLILSLAGTNGGDSIGIGYTIAYILGFGLFMLTIGKNIIDRVLPWMQTKLSWPGGVLGISIGVCLLCAAFTESIGIHAILGAFICGIAIGDSVQLHERAREIIHQFVTNFFAPLFFVSIGLKVNFITNFDAVIVGIVILFACVGKVIGASVGARLGGMTQRQSLSIGFGLNARGAMEIILGTLALNAGIISTPLFVALVIMALFTSLTSGPLIKKFYE